MADARYFQRGSPKKVVSRNASTWFRPKVSGGEVSKRSILLTRAEGPLMAPGALVVVCALAQSPQADAIARKNRSPRNNVVNLKLMAVAGYSSGVGGDKPFRDGRAGEREGNHGTGRIYDEKQNE